MNFFTTGNETVDEIGEINFSGNVTPQIWYKTVVTEKGKPHYLAISILSDIVYWYRPAEIRDENTGRVIGWKKRFRDDLLQRSYEQFAEMYGESKKTITRAILLLEELGVVKRVFRTITLAGGMTLNNVLFISLNVDRLTALTYPRKEEVVENERHIQKCRNTGKDETEDTQIAETTGSDGGAINVSTPVDNAGESLWTDLSTPVDNVGESLRTDLSTPMDKFGERVWTDLSIPVDNLGESLWTDLYTPVPTVVQTNTEITTETTTENSINRSSREGIAKADEVGAYRNLFRKKIDYDYLCLDCSTEKIKRIDEIVELVVETLLVKQENIRIGGKTYPRQLVRNRLLQLDIECIRYVLTCMQKNTGKVHNIKAYLLTALFNAPVTISNFYMAEVNNDMRGN